MIAYPMSLIAADPARPGLSHMTDYPDTGCDAAPSCLSCPLPRCVFDVTRAEREGDRLADRAAQIRTMRAKGMTTAQICSALNITKSMMFRDLRRGAR